MLFRSEILLVLSGTAENLLTITGKSIDATLDFSALGHLTSGSYNVPISFTIPDTLSIVTEPGTLPVTLTVDEAEETLVPEEEETEDLEEEEEI